MRTVLILIAFVVFSPSAIAQKPEPKYKGKPLAYWVERLQKGEIDKDQLDAAEAIKAFGRDAEPVVPTLIEMIINDRSGNYQYLIGTILHDLSHKTKGVVPELAKRLKELQARKPGDETETKNTPLISTLIWILIEIGPDAKDAVPVLISMLDNPELKDLVVKALCCIGPAAKDAIPAIRRVVLNLIADMEKQKEPLEKSLEAISYYHLTELGPDVLPLLLELLDRPGLLGKRLALREFIWEQGPIAQKAVPELTLLLQDKNTRIRFFTAYLIWKVEKNKAVVPVLVTLLLEPGSLLVKDTATLLGEIGADAKEALPTLKVVFRDRWTSYKWADPKSTDRGISSSEYDAYEAYKAVLEAIQKIEIGKAK
jgi:hypothetical protein